MDAAHPAMRQVVEPLAGPVDWGDFARAVPATRNWRIAAPIVLRLPGADLRRVQGDRWRVRSAEEIEVDEGYVWDGATRVCTTSANVLASLGHDLVCTPAEPADRQDWMEPQPKRCAVESYWRRHALYWRIGRAQGMGWLRAGGHLLGLVLLNRPYGWIRSLSGKAGE